MNLHQYRDVLFYISIITNISIPLLSIFIYKTWKNKKLLFFPVLIMLGFIALQIKIHYKDYDFKYFNEILMIIVFSKLILLFILKKDDGASRYRNILFIGFISACICTVLESDNLGNVFFDIVINLWILSFLSINIMHKKYKENELNKKKLYMNKEYIQKTTDEIKKDVENCDYTKENIKIVNEKLLSIVEVLNVPIVIIKSSNQECIFKNRYFDEFLLEHNYNKDIFTTTDFIRNVLKINPQKIFNKIKEMDFTKKNFIQIDISSKKYKVVLVKDCMEEEIIICEIQDITKVSEEENKLKQSELRYKTLMDILSDGVIIHEGTNISYINKIGLDIFELDSSINNVWTIDKIMKKISKNSQDEFEHNIFVLEKGLRQEERSKLELDNGRIVGIISSSFILNGKRMILTIVSDFTRYELALSKLEENEKTYSTLLQTLPEGIMLINKFTKKQVYTNKYMMRLLKDMGIEKFNKIIDSYIESKEDVKFKTFYVNKENNTKISIAIEQVYKQNNLLIVVRDLDIEQQLESVYNNLQIIKERNKFKTEFLIRASSNLKKPINTIFQVNKFLDNKKDIYNYDAMNSYTKTVKQNSYRLKRVLNNIEEISKIEAGIYSRDYRVYDLVKYLKELVDICSEYTKQKNIDITFQTNRREVLIYMDKNKIEKIVLNILSNAIKFTERGGEITVSLIVDKKNVIIAIKDTGSGIPSNKIDFIFENFEQVNRSLSRTAEGTGVGLYLVKKLAQVHHAQVKVNSKIGYGSKFEIILKDNFLESTKENRNQVENLIIDKEDIDLEFSDIYLA